MLSLLHSRASHIASSSSIAADSEPVYATVGNRTPKRPSMTPAATASTAAAAAAVATIDNSEVQASDDELPELLASIMNHTPLHLQPSTTSAKLGSHQPRESDAREDKWVVSLTAAVEEPLYADVKRSRKRSIPDDPFVFKSDLAEVVNDHQV